MLEDYKWVIVIYINAYVRFSLRVSKGLFEVFDH